MSENQTASLAEREIIFGFGKRLRGLGYEAAMQFLINRDGKACKKCKKDDQGQTIDHIDPFAKPLHSSKNLQILCLKCNSAKGGSKPSNVNAREREKTEWVHTRDYSAEEGEKHEVMRARWNLWMEDISKGSSNLVKSLVNKAPGRCRLGSSITYRRYLDEDIADGKFEQFRDDGKLWVRKL